MEKSTNKHGGARLGAGKKPRDPELGRRLKRAITLRPDLDALISHDRSGIIEKALEAYLKNVPGVAAGRGQK